MNLRKYSLLLALSGAACGAETEQEAEMWRTEEYGAAPAGANATVSSHTMSGTMNPGEKRRVVVNMLNSGSTTWTASGNQYSFYRQTPNVWGYVYKVVSGSVLPGATGAFPLIVTAPSVAGTYDFRGQMRTLSLSAGYFGSVLNVPAVAVNAGVQAQWNCTWDQGSSTFSTLMTAGERQNAVFAIQNSGFDNWIDAGASLCLRSQDRLTYDDYNFWGPAGTCVTMNADTNAGQTHNFATAIDAPVTPGVYRFRRQMYDFRGVGVGYFRDSTSCVDANITVTLCGNDELDTGEQCDDDNLNNNDGCSSTCQFEEGVRDLLTDSDRTFVGSTGLKQLASVGTGDFSNDGIADLVMGEISHVVLPNGNFRNTAGRVFGYAGNATFLNGSVTGLPNGAPNFEVWGANANDHLGRAADSAVLVRDVTGDGIADLIISAPSADGFTPGELTENTRPGTGEVYVLAGPLGSAGIIDLALNFGNPFLAARIQGTVAGATIRILAVGNFIGDATADLVVGAPGVSGGRVYVVEGGAALTGFVSLDSPGGVALRTVLGSSGSAIGSVAAVGDVNNDGNNDLLIGSGNASTNSRGVAWLFFGPLNAGGESTAVADVVWRGHSNFAKLGASVAIGQVVGTAHADVVLGSYQFRDTDTLQYGAVDVYDGAGLTGSQVFDLQVDENPAVLTARIVGRDRYDNLGKTVAIADLTGDGFGEIIVGASGGDGPTENRDRTGEVEIVLGGASLSGTRFLDSTGSLMRMFGAGAGDLLATYPSAVAAGDLDNDGARDICVGAHLAGSSLGNNDSPGAIYCISNPW